MTQLTERRDSNFRRPDGKSELVESLAAVGTQVSRFTQFLTLVGLAALLIGGIGVVNAVRSHLERKRDVIATYKALGAKCGRWCFRFSHSGAAAGAARLADRRGAGSGVALCRARAVRPFAAAADRGRPIIPQR